jgi:hypothetical protein
MSSEREEQRLRREVLLSDRLWRDQQRRGSSYLDHAKAAADDTAGGRWSKQSPTPITGNPIYPKAAGPWANAPLPYNPVTDALGYSIGDMEPVGTAREIEEAAQILKKHTAADGPPFPVPAADGQDGASSPSSLPERDQPADEVALASVRAGPSTSSKPKRRA